METCMLPLWHINMSPDSLLERAPVPGATELVHMCTAQFGRKYTPGIRSLIKYELHQVSTFGEYSNELIDEVLTLDDLFVP